MDSASNDENAAPLLQPENEQTVDNGQGDATDRQDASCCLRHALSFYDVYENANGVPTLVTKPQSDADADTRETHFTCFAFSSNGKLIATGDSNGFIKVWDASHYSLLVTEDNIFEESVNCLSFFADNMLVAFGDDAILSLFPLRTEEGAPAIHCETDSIVSHDLDTASQSTRTCSWQFSSDGRVFVFTTVKEDKHALQVYRIESTDVLFHIEIKTEDQVMAPLLSPNGTSVMGFVRKRPDPIELRESESYLVSSQFLSPEVRVWPKLDFDHAKKIDRRHQNGDGNASDTRDSRREFNQPCVPRDGERGSWSKNGAYMVLLKQSDKQQPMIEIYQTSDLIPARPDVSKPIAKRSLPLGLIMWDAQILDNEGSDEHLSVAIYEAFDPETRCLLIWDTVLDAITKEISVPMNITATHEAAFTPEEMKKWRIEHGTISTLENSCVTRRTHENSYLRMLESNMAPKFAVSRDRTFAAFFSWQLGAVTISSLTCGATLWNFALPPEMRSNPFSTINSCLFDKSETQLMIVGEEVLLSFVPPCLRFDREGNRGNERSSVREPMSVDGTCISPRRYHSLPGLALTKWIRHRLRIKTRDPRTRASVPEELWHVQTYADAAISADGQRLAFITNTDDEVKMYEAIPNCEVDEKGDALLDNIIPATVHQQGPHSYTPAKVFLHKTRDRRCDVRLTLGWSPHPCDRFVVHFYYLASHRSKYEVSTERLKRGKFTAAHLVSSQSADGRCVLLLDTHQVHVFDMEDWTWKTVDYNTDFEKILKLCNLSSWWDLLAGHRRMRDDGECVLFGWNIRGNHSIIVKPEMSGLEVQERVRQQVGDISFECAISHDGRWVTYVDSDGLQRGEFAIGVYDTEGSKTVHRVTLGLIPFQMGDRDGQISDSLRSLFFGMSQSGEELVVANWNGQPVSDNAILSFTPYAADGWLPGYRQVESDHQATTSRSDEAFFDELYRRYGLGLCNMPVNSGKSLFQTALLQGDTAMKSAMVKLSKKHKFSLSMKWSPSMACTEATRAQIDECFSRERFLKRRDDAQELMHLICDELFCYNQCSRISKDVFIDLWRKHQQILRKLLSENMFVYEACRLNVHPDFFAQKNHQDLYVETVDTTLEWSLAKDRDAINQHWRNLHQDKIAEMEKEGDTSTVEASLKIVCLEDIAQMGMDGILRRLLIKNPPDYYFKYDIVKWTIILKWEMYWKNCCRNYTVAYVLFVVCFTFYAWLIGFHSDISFEDRRRWGPEAGLFVLCWMYAAYMFWEEYLQITSFRKDGIQYFESAKKGLELYFCSFWNCIQLLSCVILLLLIPLFHILTCVAPAFKSTLIIIVAFEAVLVWFKIWYHAQAFEITGALVLMINNIIRESVYFLLLAFMILAGFSIAFFVMFQHLSENRAEDNKDEQSFQKSVDQYFGTLLNSVLTLFYALFSNFQAEMYMLTADASAAIAIAFFVYVLFETVVLLNLLIAIMGDTFDKVKSKEEAQLLKGRAQYIDAGEAALTEAARRKFQERIGTYLVALVPANSEHTSDTRRWTGRMNTIINEVQTAIRNAQTAQREESERRLQQMLHAFQAEMLQAQADQAVA